MSGRLNRVRVVLNKPEGALNAGAVCRAMNCFKAADRFHTDRYFRHIPARAGLNVREARQKIFRKLQYLKSDGSSS